VGHNQKGEWLKYTVNVEADGEYEISANVGSDNTTGSFVLYMDGERIGDEMASAGLGFDSLTVVEGGKATLTKGEHELKLEITNDWIDIDYIEFKAVTPSKITKVRLDMTEAESSFSVFDMQGIKLGSFTAKGMDDAMSLVKENAKLRRQGKGVFFIRKNGDKPLTKKVVIHE